MDRRTSLIGSLAFIAGLVITLATGLVDVTPAHIVGATWHGLPLVWLYVIVYPGLPWSIDWMNFAGDLVLWTVLSTVVLFLVFGRTH